MDVLEILNLSRLTFLRGREKLAFLQEGIVASDVLAMSVDDLSKRTGRRFKAVVRDRRVYRSQAEADLRYLERGAAKIVGLWQEDFPALLKGIWDPPFVLWHRGHLPPGDAMLFAVVGTRFPSEGGRLAAWRFGMDCASCGVGVISGLAYGIDGAAHAGTLDGGGYTMAVLAGGIDEVQPRMHARLAARMIDAGGALISEFGVASPSLTYQFPRRNRLISGLCPVLVVIEAPEKSGALISANYSLEEGREVVVHQVGFSSSRGLGTRNLVNDGARIVAGPNDLLSHGGFFD